MRRGSSLRDHHARDTAPAEVGGWRLLLVGALLTLCGIALLARAIPLWQKSHSAIEDHLTGADPASLRSNLRVLSARGAAKG